MSEGEQSLPNSQIYIYYVVSFWLPLGRDGGEAGFQEGLEMLVHWLMHVVTVSVFVNGYATNKLHTMYMYLFSAAVCLQQRCERVDSLSCNNNATVNNF